MRGSVKVVRNQLCGGEMVFIESWKDAVSKEVKVWRGGS